MNIVQQIVGLIAGLIFGVGLSFAGMTDPEVLRAFLNPLGDWNDSLMFVMGSAIAVTAPAYYFIFKREKPIFSDSFQISELKQIDKKLIFGGVLFGVGWGVYGLCPGPAIVQLLSFQMEIIIFVLAMILGMIITEKVSA